MAKIFFTDIERRACIARGKNALFHKWTTRKQVIGQSPMIGGHPGGQIEFTFGLVEYEDGTIEEIVPAEITFIDGRIKELFQQLRQEQEGDK